VLTDKTGVPVPIFPSQPMVRRTFFTFFGSRPAAEITAASCCGEKGSVFNVRTENALGLDFVDAVKIYRWWPRNRGSRFREVSRDAEGPGIPVAPVGRQINRPGWLRKTYFRRNGCGNEDVGGRRPKSGLLNAESRVRGGCDRFRAPSGFAAARNWPDAPPSPFSRSPFGFDDDLHYSEAGLP